MGWFDLRFVQDPTKIETKCNACGRSMYFPKSKASLYKTCGGECAESLRKKLRDESKSKRERTCATCGQLFYPRFYQLKTNQGKFCSFTCAIPAITLSRSKETYEKIAQTKKKRLEEHMKNGVSYLYYYGEENKQWKGGIKETQKRRVLSGKAARALKEYRIKNPERYKEWTQKRKSGYTGRLPRGTITKIAELQKWKCAVCGVCLKNGYHIDHIYPLSKGGKHEPYNLQLLCKQCNLTKSAKDPIEFMQSKGFLI